jgi:hypothetical protein
MEFLGVESNQFAKLEIAVANHALESDQLSFLYREVALDYLNLFAVSLNE